MPMRARQGGQEAGSETDVSAAMVVELNISLKILSHCTPCLGRS